MEDFVTEEADKTPREIPTVKEIFEAAEKAKYDSLGICADPELLAILEEGMLDQKIKALMVYREKLWKELGLVK